MQTESIGAVAEISRPQGVIHHGHVGVKADGSFDVSTAPLEMRKTLQELDQKLQMMGLGGLKAKELNFVLDFIKQHEQILEEDEQAEKKGINASPKVGHKLCSGHGSVCMSF